MEADTNRPNQSSRAFSIRQLAYVITGIALSMAMIRIPVSLADRIADSRDGIAGFVVLYPWLYLAGVLGLLVFTIAPIGYCLTGVKGKKFGIRLAIVLWLLFVLVGLLSPRVVQTSIPGDLRIGCLTSAKLPNGTGTVGRYSAELKFSYADGKVNLTTDVIDT